MAKTKFKFPPIIKSLDELDERYRTLAEDVYEKDGDEYVFQGFDESEAKKKTDEFRSTNRAYFKKIKELEAQQAKFLAIGEDFDPEAYKAGQEALAKLKKLNEEELLSKGEVETVFKTRLQSAIEPYEKQLKAKDSALAAIQQEKDTYKKELDGLVVDGLVTRVAAKVGTPKKGALPHILNHGRQTWRLNKEGKAQAHLPNGELWYGKDGNPITEEEWGAKLLEDAGFMFEPGKGAGEKGGNEESGQRGNGHVKYVDRSDPRAMAKYAKELLEGTAVAV